MWKVKYVRLLARCAAEAVRENASIPPQNRCSLGVSFIDGFQRLDAGRPLSFHYVQVRPLALFGTGLGLRQSGLGCTMRQIQARHLRGKCNTGYRERALW